MLPRRYTKFTKGDDYLANTPTGGRADYSTFGINTHYVEGSPEIIKRGDNT